MPAIDVLYGKSSFLRLLPTTLTDGKISALGTKIDFVRIADVKPVVVSAIAAAGDVFFTSEGSNNNRYSVPDKSKHYNVTTGAEIAGDTGSDSNDKFEADVFPTPSQRTTIKQAFKDGTPVFAIRDIGKKATSQTVAGYEYIMGTITDFVDTPDNGPSKIAFSITGTSTYSINETVTDTPDLDEADFNSAVTGASNTIEPDNEPVLTITAIDATDWADIILGKIVTKNTA